jgi:hypothetical protein
MHNDIAELRTEVKNKMRTCPLLGVIAGLIPAIHVFGTTAVQRRGSPEQVWG